MNENKRLKLFDDLPLFELTKEKECDYSQEHFGHEVYANNLKQIIKDNKGSLTIGLFGSWGTGKTSIINMLVQKIIHDDNKICPVLFNAWRHTGDSFRRQLLIAVGKKVYTENNDSYKELIQLTGINEKLISKEDQNSEQAICWNKVLKGLGDLWKSTFRSKGKSDRLIQLAIAIWSILIIIGTIGVLIGQESLVSFLTTIFALPIVLLLFGAIEKGTRHKLIATLKITQPSTEKARLSYPEQFEIEFDKCLVSLNGKGERLLVVIDDLDRCDDKTITDSLSVIKQFTGKKDCVFIVPCDEEQVLNAVNSEQSKHKYKYESLRKFFDVSIRMDNILDSDLHYYATQLVDKWKISPRIAEIAIYSGARDARKVKSFLNAFKTRLWMIKEREQNKHFKEGISENNIALIAKLVALQEQFKEFYKELTKDPLMLKRVEHALKTAPQKNVESKKASDLNACSLLNKDPYLKIFLKRTSDIDLSDVNEMLSGKSPEIIIKIPNGSKIMVMLGEGNSKEFVEEIKEFSSADAHNLVSYLKKQIREFIEQGYISLGQAYVETSLGIFSNKEIWCDETILAPRRNLADVLVLAIHALGRKVIGDTLDVETIERILNDTSKSVIFSKDIISFFIDKPSIKNEKEYLDLFNRNSQLFGGELEKVNTKINELIEAGVPLDTIDEILVLSEDDLESHKVPSVKVIEKITDSLQGDGSSYTLDQKKCKVLGKYKSKVNIVQFFNKWKQLTKTAQSSTVQVEDGFFLWWLDMAIEFSKCINKEEEVVILTELHAIWQNNTDIQVRSKLIYIYTNLYPVLKNGNRKEVEEKIVEWLYTKTAKVIRDYLEIWTDKSKIDLPEERCKEIKGLGIALIKRLTAWLNQQSTSYDDRINEVVQIIYDFKTITNIEKEIHEIISNVLDSKKDAHFSNWNANSLGILTNIVSVDALEDLANKIMEKIQDSSITKERRLILLELLLFKYVPKNFKAQDTDKFFNLVWHDDDNIRNPICDKYTNLEEKFNQTDIERNIPLFANKIFTASNEDVTKKISSVRIMLKYRNMFGSNEKSELIRFVSRLIQSTNPIEMIAIGLEIGNEIETKGKPPENLKSGLSVLLSHKEKDINEKVNKLLVKFGITQEKAKSESKIEAIKTESKAKEPKSEPTS